MPPGGKRTGRPGATYQQRSDLQSGDRQYGDGVNKAAVVAATPGSPARPTTGGPGPIAVGPGMLTPLDAPSNRPDEPVTAGLAIGPGSGPVDGLPVVNDDLWRLRALAKQYPSRELMRLIALAESRL